MNKDEAREALLLLAAEIQAEFPSVPPEAFVLRNEMMDALLQAKPTSREAWLRQVPFELRMGTDGQQIRTCLPKIFAITGRMAR